MEPVHEVQLTAPTSHHIFLRPQKEGDPVPLSGSVEVTVSASSIRSSHLPRVSVKLSRTISSEPPCLGPPRRQRHGFLENLRRRRSIECQPHTIRKVNGYSDTKTITQCDLWHVPDHVRYDRDNDKVILGFSFALPILSDIPSTTTTALGTVSYEITATSTTTNGSKVSAKQPVQILRRALPDYPRTAQHVRTFCGDQVTIVLDITPKESPGDSEFLYTAKLSLKKTVRPGPRASEIRNLVVKELKWQVEETAQVVSRLDHDGNYENNGNAIPDKKESRRELCNSGKDGPWGANDEGTIQICFDVNIPKSTGVTEDINVDIKHDCLVPRASDECHPGTAMAEETVGMIANHQLRLDIIVGEDTFDQTTGKLVDRKSRWKSFSPRFPLPVYEFASPNEIPEAVFLGSQTPPVYEDASKPPTYENI
ncbi:hypothetical protein FE257_005620 [Aspergillus nanangensis]|uniref:Uncharacterized protein n=1 Tax=Aspergillus nanangensis TaxID=2582783 RepID=A0AAD4CQG9_ASPNN|nr:hypothetical protein FE257_005620 [Aspergillus nanangensis]